MLGVPGGLPLRLMLFVVGVFAIVMGAVPLVLYWIIFRKAGLPEPLALLVVVPGFGPLIPPLILAVADWPALRAHDGNETNAERDSTSTQQANNERKNR
jgi:hypothetical protein